MADSSGDESEAHAPPSTVELLLQQIMAKQEQMEERSTRRFVAMQATIDAQEAALAAATAAQPGASIWAARLHKQISFRNRGHRTSVPVFHTTRE